MAGAVDYQSRLKQALAALQKMRLRLEAVERARTEPIAIVGLACRFPGGVHTPDEYWTLLRNKVDAITDVPRSRWDADRYFDPDPEVPGKTYVKQAGFIEDVDRFDASFFGISPREAQSMDPQQRLFLEIVWQALEHAGIPPDSLVGSPTGVFVGVTLTDYLQLYSRLTDARDIDAYLASGNTLNATAGRVAFTLGLQGPAVALDTACSSSLTAVHVACQSLRSGETRMAMAGGVNVMLSPDWFICFSKWKMLAADGRCKTFDARADGFVRGEGCGVVVLKRLSDALADGDTIHAVIRASAANQDGKSSGLTVPNGVAQEAVIRQALATAGIDPATVAYVEAHGTGTTLGDPIEIEALGAAYCRQRPADLPLLIGSVKTNIGHLEAASGIAGLIKTVLALSHGAIPGQLHLQQRSPYIRWENLPIEIPTELTPWPAGRRLAGVSSFGFSGTNVHVLVEEPPAAPPPQNDPERPIHVLALSAKSNRALNDQVTRYAALLTGRPELSLADVCFTANTGRATFDHRVAVVAESLDALSRTLTALGSSPSLGNARRPGERPKVGFLFTGQGAQYSHMGRQLYQTQPIFRAALDRCARILDGVLPQPLLSVMHPEDADRAALLDQTAYTQPALFAIEYALVELWRSWGVEPAMAVGHSVGEYVAACVAGCMALEDALVLIAERGRLMQALPPGGAMAAVFADEARVRAVIAPHAGHLAIAAVNAPDNVVISGAADRLDTCLREFEVDGTSARRLAVSHAFHSPLMTPMLDAFERAAERVRFAATRIPVVSNLTGEPFAPGEEPTAAYWRRHAREAVRFARAIEVLHSHGCELFLEIGPQPTLLGMARRVVAENVGTWLPSLRKGRDDWRQLLESVAAMYERGVDVDWAGFDRGYSRRRVVLPTYPFERQRYWLRPAASQTAPAPSRGARAGAAVHPLLGSRLRTASGDAIFEAELSPVSHSYLADHRVSGAIVLPATAYLEMAIAAADAVFGGRPGTSALVEALAIHQPLVLSETGGRTVQLVLKRDANDAGAFEIASLEAEAENGDVWHLHAAGRVRWTSTTAEAEMVSFGAIEASCTEQVAPSAHYDRMRDRGIDFGDSFRGVEWIRRREHEAVGVVRMADVVAGEAADYRMHPAFLDACLQPLASVLPARGSIADTFLPIGVERFHLYRRPSHSVWSHARLRTPNGANGEVTGDVRLFDPEGRLIAEVAGLRLKRVSRDVLRHVVERDERPSVQSRVYEIAWRLGDREAAEPAAGIGHTWLVLADRGGVGADLVRRAREAGQRCVVVTAGEDCEELGDGSWRANAGRPEDFARILREVSATVGAPTHVVHLWSLDAPSVDGTTTSADVQAAQVEHCGSALHLAQALVGLTSDRAAQLWLVTRGAQPIDDVSPVAVAQSTIWGFASTLSTEHPELRCARIDLDPSVSSMPGGDLLREIACPDGEEQIALRGGSRYVARLVRCDATSVALAAGNRSGQPYRLQQARPDVLDEFAMVPVDRQAPGPREIEIRVRATGLNFRDVLSTLGMYPGEVGPLGGECAGEVAAVGDGVTEFEIGDKVMGIAFGSFASFVTTRAELAIRMSDHLSFGEAATIPSAFMTAHYALHALAGVKTGDRILIHAAAGGVGMAAVQLAQRAGAEVFATAGSAEKRAFLASRGVQHVMDSRSLTFAAEVLARTDGGGVDIVLNSLSGDFIPASLSVLRRGGRFVELGKIGIWDQDRVDALGKDLSYFVVDLAETCRTEPDVAGAVLSRVAAGVTSGSVTPLPMRVFPVHAAAAAFRCMAQAKHIGKIVVSHVDPAGDDFAARREAGPVQFRADGAYLVTGGLAGLGLRVAEWMVARGARRLVLMARSEPSAAALETIGRLEQAGASIRVVRGDVACRSDVARALEGLGSQAPPLRGVIHAAGVLAEGVVLQQDWSNFETVMAPKVSGAWNLHTLTAGMPLDFFVLFSSVASILGPAGLSNHAAACAFEDALAHVRHARGLPATSINWGPWAELGSVMRTNVGDRLRSRGFAALTPEDGLEALDRILQRGGPQVVVVEVNWVRFVRQNTNGNAPSLLRDLVAEKPAASMTTQAESDWLAQLDRASAAERQRMLYAHVREQLGTVLGLDPSVRVDPQQGLRDFGIDSLVSIELKNRLQASVGRPLPSTLVFDYPTLGALVEYLDRQVRQSAAAGPAIGNARSLTGVVRNDGLAALEHLSQDEAEALLLEELARAGGRISG